MSSVTSRWRSRSSSATSPIAAEPRAHRSDDSLHGDRHGALGEADGAVPDGATVFDDGFPAVATLIQLSSVPCARPQRMPRTTGSSSSSIVAWAFPEYQEHHLQAVSAARRGSCPLGGHRGHVCHVSGDAVDIGHSDATAWLSEHGADYGLCQIYCNEPWHSELRPEAIDHGCLPMYADPTHDPRMQQ